MGSGWWTPSPWGEPCLLSNQGPCPPGLPHACNAALQWLQLLYTDRLSVSPRQGGARCSQYVVISSVLTRECLAACRVESLFFGGMKGEIWVQPGKLPSQVSAARQPPACSNATLKSRQATHRVRCWSIS